MSRQRPTKKRKRDDDSSDEDTLDLSSCEIQLSPVASLVSVDGSSLDGEGNEASFEIPESDMNESHHNISAEVSTSQIEEISFSESIIEDRVSREHAQNEADLSSNNLNASIISDFEEITNPPTTVTETNSSVSEDSSGSNESGSASEDFSEDSASEISVSEEEIEITAEKDRPLYEGAPLSINDSMVAILCYVIRHELDGKEISDLLQLINLHCKPEQNKLKTSLYFFKKYFSCLDSPVKNHYYCSACYVKLTKEEGKISKCPNAKLHPSTTGHSIFVELPLIPQLESLFCQKEFRSNLSYRYSKSKECEENLEDIYDGQIYKELVSKGFLSPDKPLNFTMIMNTDGVPVFKSTKKSLWPIFFNVNELPPNMRFKKEFTLIGGLWFGGKPQANLMLDPLLNTFKKVEKGFTVREPEGDGSATAKGVLIAATTDLPAKIMITGMASYSGAYGCQICKVKGETVKIIKKRKGNKKKNKKEQVVKTTSVWAYKFNEALDLRSHSETIKLGKQAHHILQETKDPETNVLGVKFPSALFKIMYDGIRGFAVDDLHTLYLGVNKTLIKILFGSDHSSEPFSLRKYLPLIDERLMALRLPNFLQRGLRKIETDIAYWKGLELEIWTHYASIPLLEGIMPDKYLEHHIDLVSCLHTLKSPSISPAALLSCEKKLTNYCKNFEILYGSRYMSMNFHLLRHLVFVVNNLGTMRYTSCYPYEGLNGEILKMIHGTRYVETQLASGCFLIRQLPKSIETLSSEQVKDFCYRLLHPSLRLKKLEDISDDMFSVGTYKAVTSQQQYIFESLQEFGIEEANIESFLRLKRGKLLFVSRSYTRSVKKNSSVCSFISQDILKNGTIDIFVKVTSKSNVGPKVVSYFAIIQSASLLPYIIGSKEVPHIFRYCLNNDYIAIPLCDLRDMFVSVEVDDRAFVCKPIY